MGPALVGLGASAGGVEALTALLPGLASVPAAAVFVVLHQPATAPSVLADLLDRCCPWPVAAAVDGEPVEVGRVYVAPPGGHLLVRRGRVRLHDGPREPGHGPSVDLLLRSLGAAAGPLAVGVVLSGTLDDGASGLHDLVRDGGSALVQTPDDAAHPGMPCAALARVPTAVCVPLAGMAGAIADAVASAYHRTGASEDGQEGRDR